MKNEDMKVLICTAWSVGYCCYDCSL